VFYEDPFRAAALLLCFHFRLGCLMGKSDRSHDSLPIGEESELTRGHVLLERYRIEGKLGTGGIGIVYRAVQLPLERPVAVKVLHDDLLTLVELRVRFEREARVLSALTHPHVVSISDYGIDGERPFLVMEMLEGRTLEDVVHGDPLEPETALSIARQVLLGLACAHEKGIAHRDLKPANVFLSRMPDGSEHVKLLDFGLARMVQSDGEVDDEPVLTKRGVIFGTPAYMSPEQASGSAVDERSDVYSAGVLLFELLAGRRPFVGETRAELLRAHLTAPVPRIASVRPELRVHPELVHVLDVAMSKEAHDRYATAGEMLAALDAIEAPVAWLVDPNDVSEAPTQVASPPPFRTIPPPRRPFPFALLALVVGVPLLAVVGWIAWPKFSQRMRAGVIHLSGSEDLIGDPTRPAPRDPWATPPPEPLRPYLSMVQRGYVFQDRREIAPLFALVREMPRDPRPRLLVGHLFSLKGWHTEAIRRYELAARADASARGDPRMLTNLVHAASRESSNAAARRAILRIYGTEALGVVQAEVRALDGQAVPQLRMVRLRDELRAIEQNQP
jgi:serine/threonine-protein kinase